MKMIILLLFLSLNVWAKPAAKTAATPPAASADSTPGNEVKSAPAKVVFKKTEQHQFSGAQLKGNLKKPELSYIYERKGVRQEKIVNIPEHFNEEIYNGANQF